MDRMTPAVRRRLVRFGAACTGGFVVYLTITHFLLGDGWLAAIILGIIVIGFAAVAVSAWTGRDEPPRR